VPRVSNPGRYTNLCVPHETDCGRNFNGTPKGLPQFRGAYAGEGTNPGWVLRAEKKVGGPGTPGRETLAPASPQGFRLLP
jgi:hypothetical protein